MDVAKNAEFATKVGSWKGWTSRVDPNEPTTRKVLPKTKGSTRKLGASPTTHGKFNIDVFFHFWYVTGLTIQH
jgi:hypothetical protein